MINITSKLHIQLALMKYLLSVGKREINQTSIFSTVLESSLGEEVLHNRDYRTFCGLMDFEHLLTNRVLDGRRKETEICPGTLWEMFAGRQQFS